MLPLRHAVLWRALSALILILALVATMAPAFWFDSRREALLWFENADKWLHGIAFGALAIWFSGLFEKRRYWRLAVALMLFGLLVEACQLKISYRSADWLDVVANAAGIIVGFTVAVAGLGGWGLRLEDWYSRRQSH